MMCDWFTCLLAVPHFSQIVLKHRLHVCLAWRKVNLAPHCSHLRASFLSSLFLPLGDCFRESLYCCIGAALVRAIFAFNYIIFLFLLLRCRNEKLLKSQNNLAIGHQATRFTFSPSFSSSFWSELEHIFVMPAFALQPALPTEACLLATESNSLQPESQTPAGAESLPSPHPNPRNSFRRRSDGKCGAKGVRACCNERSLVSDKIQLHHELTHDYQDKCTHTNIYMQKRRPKSEFMWLAASATTLLLLCLQGALRGELQGALRGE